MIAVLLDEDLCEEAGEEDGVVLVDDVGSVECIGLIAGEIVGLEVELRLRTLILVGDIET